MSRNNTGNPIGSGDPRDREDNSKNLDQAMNASGSTWTDRFGVTRKTMAGQESAFDADQLSRESAFVASQADKQARFNAFIAASGYIGTGVGGAIEDYSAGITITEYNQIIRDSFGEFWRLTGSQSLPYTTTGAGLPEGGAFVSVGDAALRQELASNTGAQLVGTDTGEDLQNRLNQIDALTPNSQLGRAYSNCLPVGMVVPPSEFNDQLNLRRLCNGSQVVYLQDPYDMIDFSKNPDVTVNTYYVNYLTGNNSDAGTSSPDAWKTLQYALANAVSPAVILIEDQWVGTNSLTTPVSNINGKIKIVGAHPSRRALITSMNENYTKATFNWLDEGGGCWSTSAATTTTTIFNRLGVACFDEKFQDNKGRAMPLPQAASAAECIATPGTQFHDVANSKKYVHLLDGREPDPFDGFIYSDTRSGVNFTQQALTGGVLLWENVGFYMNSGVGTTAGCRHRHVTTAVNDSIFGVNNVIVCGASTNGIEVYDAEIAVIKNSFGGYNRSDNFNYHSFVSTGSKGEYMTVYEYGSDGLPAGYDGFINQPVLSPSANGSTAHDSLHIERCNCVYAGGNGATVADVNGCVSVNWCVDAGPPTGGTFRGSFWTEKLSSAGASSGMWLWGCSGHDGDDPLNSLITNEAQSGGSSNDGQVCVKYWRGKTGGNVVGSLKDFSGNDL